MFASPVAKPASAPPQRSAVAVQRPGPAAPEQSLQQTIGDRIPARRASARENDDTGRETARSWNFSKIPVFSSGGADRFQKPPLFPARRLPGPIQAKLRIGAINDPLEHEADRVADQVLRLPAPELSVAAAPGGVLRRKCACGDQLGAGEECAECGKAKNSLQRKADHAALHIQRFTGQPTGEMGPAPASVDEALASPGRPLEPALRQDMEQRFGHDFSRVRVHLDSRAAASAREVGALAYTVGRDVVFAQGQFAPHSQEGRRLLAHELTHTVQQGAGGPATTSDAGQTVLRRDGDEQSKGSGAPGPANDAGGEKAPASVPAPVPAPAPAAAAKGSGASCDPKPLSRADYLKEPGTRTDDFGLTTLSGHATVPVVHVGKGGVLDSTAAGLPPLTSVYTAAGTFIEGELLSPPPTTECPSGKYPGQWHILSDGAQKFREAEIEHCDDFQHAFAISLKRYAGVVNDLAAKKKVFASQKAAEKYVAGLVGPSPDTWADVFSCLINKTKLRDPKRRGDIGWHTPIPLTKPPRLKDNCEFARAFVTASSFPEVGKHPTAEVIQGCGEGPPVKAKAGAKQAGTKTKSAPAPQTEGKVEKPISLDGMSGIAAPDGPGEIIFNGPDSKQDSKPPPPPPKAPAPKQQTPAKAAGCPADIKVARIDPLNDTDFGKNGWVTGWGAIVRMEVSDPDGKTWDGTEVHENIKQTKNTCGARARDACTNKSGEGGSGGSTFKVGSATKVQGKSIPAVKNSFYDLHIVARKDASILHALGKAECEVQCHQFYDCGGKQIGPDFTITYSMKKDTVYGTYDVTRVTAKKEAVTKAAAPAATPSGGAEP
jgi:hypothetical protein